MWPRTSMAGDLLRESARPTSGAAGTVDELMKIDLKKFLAMTALMSNGIVAASGCLVIGTGDDTNNDEVGDGDGDPTGSEAGDGDGDPTTTGDGDGDPTTGDGDGDGDTWECSNGETIPLEFVCDEGADCSDNSDEVTGCEIPAANCSDGTEIPDTWLCDEFPDCADQSDEVSGCGIEAFVCGDGVEVPAAYVCDTVNDCADGSDEANCN